MHEAACQNMQQMHSARNDPGSTNSRFLGLVISDSDSRVVKFRSFICTMNGPLYFLDMVKHLVICTSVVLLVEVADTIYEWNSASRYRKTVVALAEPNTPCSRPLSDRIRCSV